MNPLSHFRHSCASYAWDWNICKLIGRVHAVGVICSGIFYEGVYQTRFWRVWGRVFTGTKGIGPRENNRNEWFQTDIWKYWVHRLPSMRIENLYNWLEWKIKTEWNEAEDNVRGYLQWRTFDSECVLQCVIVARVFEWYKFSWPLKEAKIIADLFPSERLCTIYRTVYTLIGCFLQRRAKSHGIRWKRIR